MSLSFAQQAAPYKESHATTLEMPGKDAPEPVVSEVLLGYFGPDDAVRQGATLAIEEANAAGGYQGKPFRLATGWSDNVWRAGASFVTRMAFRDNVWVIIGSVDGAATHLAEQVAAKALVPLVNPVATDRSLHLAGVALMFSVVQGDDAHASVLAAALREKKVVVVSATDHDSRAFLGQLKTRVRVQLQIDFDPVRPDLSEQAASAAAARPDVVVVIAGARDSARAVKALRVAGYKGLIAGSPTFGRAEFLREAEDGLLFPWGGALAAAFREKYQKRWGNEPDYAAACAYDAVTLVAAAIRKAGLNRGRIRDAIADLSPYDGASGRIEWDGFGQNRRPPVLTKIDHGTVITLAP